MRDGKPVCKGKITTTGIEDDERKEEVDGQAEDGIWRANRL